MATFYVSPTGNDSASGTNASTPFATLAKAQQAMRSSAGADTTVVGGGIYTLSAPIALTSADNGSSFVEAAGQNAIISGDGLAITLFSVSDASDIAITGLTLQDTTSAAQEAEDAQAAINILNSSAITIDGNAFGGIPKGVQIDDLTYHVTVSGNSFLNIGSSAVEMTPTSHESTVTNNTMSHTGYQFPNAGGGAGAIQMVESWGNLVSHNRVTDVADRGVNEINYDPNIKSGGNIIEYNIITHTGQATNDTGAIYAFSSQDGAALGSTIRYNSITDTGGTDLSWGVYLDDLTHDAQVYGNFVDGTKMGGVMLHGGDGNHVYDNVLINNDTFGLEFLEIGSNSQLNNTVHHNLIEIRAGSMIVAMDPTLVTPAQIHDNLYVSPTAAPPNIADGTFAQWQSLGGDMGTDIITSAQFTDSAAGDFSFAPDAFALTQGLTQLPWSSMGPPGNTPPPTEVTIGTLVLQLSEDYYEGNAMFIVKMDGKQIGGPTEVTARYSSGATQSFSFQADWTPGEHEVEVDFINDWYGGTMSTDRNLWIDKVGYDGKSYGPASDVPLYWNGPFTISVGSDTTP